VSTIVKIDKFTSVDIPERNLITKLLTDRYNKYDSCKEIYCKKRILYDEKFAYFMSNFEHMELGKAINAVMELKEMERNLEKLCTEWFQHYREVISLLGYELGLNTINIIIT